MNNMFQQIFRLYIAFKYKKAMYAYKDTNIAFVDGQFIYIYGYE
jgi:hypothetical protein